jgi:hypothetical protein
MSRSVAGNVQAKRTELRFRTCASNRIVENTINQPVARTGMGDIRFELGRTNQNFIEIRFDGTTRLYQELWPIWSCQYKAIRNNFALRHIILTLKGMEKVNSE